MSDIDPEKLDAAAHKERTRLVALLRKMADKLEAAPMERITDGMTWIAPIADVLVQTVERRSAGPSRPPWRRSHGTRYRLDVPGGRREGLPRATGRRYDLALLSPLLLLRASILGCAMQRTVQDIIIRVKGLRDRIDEQPIQASKDQLNAIHVALTGLLRRLQERPANKATG